MLGERFLWEDELPFPGCEPAGYVYRISTHHDPWELLDWAYGPFHNRFDDPYAEYRVLYASTQKYGAYLETLSRFRPDPLGSIEQGKIRSDARDTRYGRQIQSGQLPSSWLHQRSLGVAKWEGTFAQIGHSRTLETIRKDLGKILSRSLRQDMAAAIRRAEPRSFTQAVSRYIFEKLTAEGRRYAGIHYFSRHGDDIENFALFETFHANCFPVAVEPLDLEDPDFQRALEVFSIELVEH